MTLFGIVPESFHHRPFSVLAALVPPARHMAPVASERHQKSSPLISAQEKTQSDVKDQENPTDCISQVCRHRETGREWFNNLMSVARRPRPGIGDRLHFPGPSGNPEVVEPGASDLGGYYCMPKRESRVLRLPQDPTSLKTPAHKHRETDCRPL